MTPPPQGLPLLQSVQCQAPKALGAKQPKRDIAWFHFLRRPADRNAIQIYDSVMELRDIEYECPVLVLRSSKH